MNGPALRIVGGDAQTRGFVARALVGLPGPAAAQEMTILLLPPTAERALDAVERAQAVDTAPLLALMSEPDQGLQQQVMQSGAVDCLPLPRSRGELALVVRMAWLDAAGAAAPPRAAYTVRGLAIDVLTRAVTRNGRAIALTSRQRRLLICLAERAGHVVSHRRLLREVCGSRSLDALPSLRVCVAQLRRKIEDDPARPSYLLTERRIGYRLADR